MLGMKNHFDINGSIEIREVDIARVACTRIFQNLSLNDLTQMGLSLCLSNLSKYILQ